MAKKAKPTSAANYLKLNMRLNAVLLRLKEKAKEHTGRSFGTHAVRGTANYEYLIRQTLDESLRLADKDKLFSDEEKVMIKDRLIHDYNYGYNIRERERQVQDLTPKDQPVMDQTTINKRMQDIEERKRENIRRTTDKFMKWRGGT